MHNPTNSLHLIADIEQAERLDDLPFVESVLREAAVAARVTIVGINLHHFGEGGGVTGVAVLAESHISIHTWPECGLVAVDMFVCGKTADAHAGAGGDGRAVRRPAQPGQGSAQAAGARRSAAGRRRNR